MASQTYSLVMHDASLIDVSELKTEVPEGDLSVVKPASDSESHGELATILIISLSAPALTAFTLWLLRTRKSEVIEYQVTIRRPDGTEVETHLKIKRTESEAPEDQVIEQIAKALKVPADTITAAMAG